MRTLLGEVLSAVAKAVEPFRERIADTLIDFCDDLEDIVDEWNTHSDNIE